jgi:serine/threonine protein kinase
MILCFSLKLRSIMSNSINDNVQIGNYRITTEIGSGGYGKVYQGQHAILLERIVAIKLLHSHLSSPEERERFLAEARVLEHLKHPHILLIFDVGIHEGFPYLVAEYAPNGSLRHRIRKYLPNPLPIEEALTILAQVGEGLSYAHYRNVIHRDLKPENILFNAQDHALLADFGLATTLSTASIKQTAIVGTPSYMAPEQFQNSISKEGDQYALGCIAYELFTGRPPFTASDFFAIGFEHLMKDPVPPTQLNPSLPLHIEGAILKAIAKQRADRHADIRAFIRALHTPVEADPQISLPTLPGTFTPLRSTSSSYHQPPTPIPPAADQSGIPFHQERAIPFSPSTSARAYHGGRQIENPASMSPPPFVPAGSDDQHSYPGNQRDGKRNWFLIAVACLLVIVSVSSIVAFALSHNSPQSDKVVVSQTAVPTSTPRPTSSLNKHSPTRSTTPGSVATPTYGSIATPTRSPGATSTQGSTVTPTPTSSPTSGPKPSETVTAQFIKGPNAMQTQYSYTGNVKVTVSGFGEVGAAPSYSDGFYIYTNTSGTPVPPWHKTMPPSWTLCINGQDADSFVPLPPYNQAHIYTFTITAPGGHITFGVCDHYLADNSGSYTISISQQ